MLSKNEIIELLSTVDIFKHLSSKYMLDIANATEIEFYEDGESIITKGEKGDCMFIIFEGAVRVHDGDVVFAKLKSPDFFGELSVLSPEPRIASVTTVEDSGVIKLSRQDFFDIVGYNVEVYQAIIHALANRLRKMNEAIKNLPSLNKP